MAERKEWCDADVGDFLMKRVVGAKTSCSRPTREDRESEEDCG